MLFPMMIPIIMPTRSGSSNIPPIPRTKDKAILKDWEQYVHYEIYSNSTLSNAIYNTAVRCGNSRMVKFLKKELRGEKIFKNKLKKLIICTIEENMIDDYNKNVFWEWQYIDDKDLSFLIKENIIIDELYPKLTTKCRVALNSKFKDLFTMKPKKLKNVASENWEKQEKERAGK